MRPALSPQVPKTRPEAGFHLNNREVENKRCQTHAAVAYSPGRRYGCSMDIKLPYLPFKFDTPEGRMEVTVRRGTGPETGGKLPPFVAGLAFIQAGPRALDRILLSVKSDTYGGAMSALTGGFKVNLAAHDEETVEYRVL